MKNLIVKTLLFGSILNSLNMGIHNQSLNLINIDFRKKIFMDRNITKAIDNGFIFETNLENIKSKELFDLGYNNFVDKFCNNKDLFGFSEDNYSTYGTFSYFFSGNEDLIIENLKVLKYFTFENIEEQVKYSTTKLNIRDGADVSYNVIDTLGINEEVIVDGICSNGWFKIKLKDGRVGFVSNIYLSDTIVQEKIIPEEALILEKDTSYAFDIIGECKNISLINTYYNSIPQNIRDYLTNIGWKYQLTTENIAQTVFNGQYKSVMGVSLGIEKIIKIEDRKNAIIDSVFLHQPTTKVVGLRSTTS